MTTHYKCPEHGIRPPGGYDERHRCSSCCRPLQAVTEHEEDNLRTINRRLEARVRTLEHELAMEKERREWVR
ncbi:hypothetical protein BIS06_06205 [Halomonas sp. BBD48]|nr:hypothetical protein [Halomonas sp. BBD48]